MHNIHPVEILLGSPDSFLDQIFEYLKNDAIDVGSYELDHICYRVESPHRYEALKDSLLLEGKLLTETLINGRPICTFQLHQPISYKERKISLIELPYPKPGSPYPEGYEHVEFVIAGSLEDFMQRYPLLEFDQKGIKKTINPDVRLAYDKMSVKFHLYNLAYVIKHLE